jgi:hypothetical protein
MFTNGTPLNAVLGFDIMCQRLFGPCPRNTPTMLDSIHEAGGYPLDSDHRR